VEGNTTIGENCELFQFCSIGAKPQDLKFKDEPSTLVIGNGNKIREFVTIQPGTEGGVMTTIVGDANLFMANSHVGHDCVIGSNNIFANSVAIAGHAVIFDNAILGGMVGIHQFARIGSGSFISAGSMVGQDIAPFCVAQGDRCFLRGINVIGLQRAGFSEDDIASIKKAYRHLFLGSGAFNERVESLDSAVSENARVQFMLEFLAGSERGLTFAAK
ncbi:UNVERIFIED_CONTAM: hypothetical protein GTU68_041082, partial [Idotea baltica]|nr:hypothetical protein [Idotea baltica]